MSDVIHLGRRRYQVVEELTSGDRIRLRVIDRQAGPKGRPRVLHVLPNTAETARHMRVLERLATSRNVNVPYLIESYRQGEKLYVATSWTPGESLAEYFRKVREGKLVQPSAFHACRLIRGQAHGLCQLHSAWDVHHGDIKPANLILSPGGQHLATIDFGSAWLGQWGATRADGDGISGAYSPPELLEQGATPDFRSDQFSLSVVWYELLTLEIPYDGAGGRAGLAALRSAFASKLVPPSQARRKGGRGVPRGLWNLIDGAVCRGLALDPVGRFPSPRAWLDALDEIHYEFRRRGRLGVVNRLVAEWLEKLVGSFRPASRR